MNTNPLVGTWRLVSFEVRASDGRVSHPYGPDATGYIIYSPDGYMSVTITAADRPNFDASDLLGGSVEERAEAAGTYVSYCGTYEVQDATVVHRVQMSLFPNWVGTEQVRFYELKGDRLHLSTAPMLLGGSEQRAQLIWERVPSAG
ncbi:MAG: lipocalin-like domain-containing protein [Chloroflexota bacterium]|nr:lipocalin-like domain-containing protein [Chloroflexota bacterium]